VTIVGFEFRMMNPKSYTGDIICRPFVEEWNVGNEDPWADDEPF
jgi:hypothetical protein